MDTDLYKAGEKILYKEGLFKLFQDFGETEIIGAYDLGLLVNPDIDISILVPNYDIDRYFDLCKEIAKQFKPLKIKYIDQKLANWDPPYNTGLYLGIELIRDKTLWKIDVSFFTPDLFKGRIKYHNDFKNILTDGNKEIIIKIKQSIYKSPNYKSIDVYNAVIKDNVKNLEEFLVWYRQNNSKDFRLKDE